MNNPEPDVALVPCRNVNKENLQRPPPGVGTWLSARFGFAYLAFFGFFNIYTLRVNLSVAVLSMVNSSYLEPTTHLNQSSETCPESFIERNHTGGEFNWNGHEKGLVLGAFFYGYMLTQLPGGYLSSRTGGKNLFGCGILCTALLTLLTPIAARTSLSLLIAVRVLDGIGEGVTFPAMHSMLGVWAPPMERSRIISLVYSGCQFGTVFSQPISGLLCSSSIIGGWPSAFYIFGIAAVVWCCTWFAFAKSFPHELKWISKAELDYIESTVKPPPVPQPVPWKRILLSKEVWAICAAHFSSNWGFYTLLTCLPLYLQEVLKYDISQDGFISALPYLCGWISTNVSGVVTDKLREKGVLNTTQTRKTFSSICLIGPAVFLLVAGYVGCDKVAAVGCLCVGSVLSGFSYSGFSSNHVDIAPRYSGVLLGISNTLATIPGFLSPVIVGILTGKNPSRHSWMIVFYISAVIYVLGAVIYVCLGTGVEQAWNRKEEATEAESPLLDKPDPLAVNDCVRC